MSHSAEKCKRGDPLGFINIYFIAKYQKIRKGDSFDTLGSFLEKRRPKTLLFISSPCRKAARTCKHLSRQESIDMIERDNLIDSLLQVGDSFSAGLLVTVLSSKPFATKRALSTPFLSVKTHLVPSVLSMIFNAVIYSWRSILPVPPI